MRYERTEPTNVVATQAQSANAKRPSQKFSIGYAR